MKTMDIDTTSVTQLITEFRALQSKDAVTPESLGYILQRVADLLTTAGTSETLELLRRLLDGITNTARITCRIEGDRVRIMGASKIVRAGYVPYLFRFTTKRNRYHQKVRSDKDADRKWCAVSKGWHLYGSRHAVGLDGDVLKFSTNDPDALHFEAKGWDTAPETLVRTTASKRGTHIPWGRSVIEIRDRQDTTSGDVITDKHRLLRLRFAVGFGRKIEPGYALVTPANLVSTLAEFTVAYDPNTKEWHFSR